jgi:hypothetical protein
MPDLTCAPNEGMDAFCGGACALVPRETGYACVNRSGTSQPNAGPGGVFQLGARLAREKLVFGRQSVAPRSRDPHLCDLDDRSAGILIPRPRKGRLGPKARRALALFVGRRSGLSERLLLVLGQG